MHKLTGLIAALLCLSFALVAPARADDSAPAQTQSLLQSAMQKAKKEHKPLLVMFHASWCGWCKKLDAVMSRPEYKTMFDKNYVTLTLDVMESKEKKAQLENPGGVEYMKELGGEQSGLPFYAFVDDKGKKLADSNAMPKNMNIGYPAEPGEIVAFMDLIKKTAPRWSDADREKLRAYLVANAPHSNTVH